MAHIFKSVNVIHINKMLKKRHTVSQQMQKTHLTKLSKIYKEYLKLNNNKKKKKTNNPT